MLGLQPLLLTVWLQPLVTGPSIWLQAYELESESVKPVEVERMSWTTPENLRKHYAVIEKVAIERGYGVANEDYDESNPSSPRLLWTRPERVNSFDEKKLTLDQNAKNKSKSNRTLTKPAMGDVGKCVATHTTQAATLCAGSRGDGKPAPMMIIFGSGDSYDTSWTLGMPTCGVVDPSTGEFTNLLLPLPFPTPTPTPTATATATPTPTPPSRHPQPYHPPHHHPQPYPPTPPFL